jgi:hypothetical protein
MTFDAIIDNLMDKNITISLLKEDGVVWFDLHTGMKSHLHIAKGENGKHKYRARYGVAGEFETFDELARIAASCMCGRDYLSDAWELILIDAGCLQKITQTTVSYTTTA